MKNLNNNEINFVAGGASIICIGTVNGKIVHRVTSETFLNDFDNSAELAGEVIAGHRGLVKELRKAESIIKLDAKAQTSGFIWNCTETY